MMKYKSNESVLLEITFEKSKYLSNNGSLKNNF